MLRKDRALIQEQGPRCRVIFDAFLFTGLLPHPLHSSRSLLLANPLVLMLADMLWSGRGKRVKSMSGILHGVRQNVFVTMGLNGIVAVEFFTSKRDNIWTPGFIPCERLQAPKHVGCTAQAATKLDQGSGSGSTQSFSQWSRRFKLWSLHRPFQFYPRPPPSSCAGHPERYWFLYIVSLGSLLTVSLRNVDARVIRRFQWITLS